MKKSAFVLALSAACQSAAPQEPPAAQPATPEVDVVRVEYAPLHATVVLPGELGSFERVDLHARADGFVQRIDVDRGSRVHAGDILALLSAPELRAQSARAIADLQGQRSTSERLHAAAATPGAVAGHDLEMADSQEAATRAQARSLSAMASYLVVRAPFDGVITERFVHPGALVGPGGDRPLVRLEATDRLRLVVSVPEYGAGHIEEGTEVSYRVRSQPGRSFTATIARSAHSVDPLTRTMPVELDVDNRAGLLAPGMYAEVEWPFTRETPSFFVPPRAIVQTTSDIFVVAIREGMAHRVPVQRGFVQGERVEVFGELQPDDRVAARGREDLAEGHPVRAREPSG